MSDAFALLPGTLASHLRLTLVSLALGAAASIPLGVWASRLPRVERLVLGVASVVQTIPALALLAVMVPALAAIGLLTERLLGVSVSSIGTLPALVGLTLYSMLPILRNTATGIAGVDPAVREAARGVGMTDRQQLVRVEIPLALPVIVAGLRTATVWVVGMATLATPVGATSLGDYIFSGLQTRNLGLVLFGCVVAAVLALVLDALLHGLEEAIRERRPRRIVVTVVALASLAFGSMIPLAGGGDAASIRVGAKTFTEQYVLAGILQGRIERATGRPATVLASLGSTVAFDALRAEEIDVYVDYTGTIWTTILGRAAGPRRDAVLDGVTDELAERHGIRVIASLGFENAYALAMRGSHARELGARSISGLARHAPSLALGADYEFLSRPEWRALRETYGLRFRESRSMDPSLMYEAVARGGVDVISAFSTDGRIAAFDLVVLEDDRGAIPPYDAIVLARPGLTADAPDVVAALAALDGTIDDDRMRAMNRAVDEEGKSPAAVARGFLDAR